MTKAFASEWNRVRRSLVVLLFFGAFVGFQGFFFLMFGYGSSGEDAFIRSLGEGLIPLVVALFFPGMYIGLLFEHRGMSQDILWGRSRFAVFLPRIIEVYLLSVLMCSPYALLHLWFFSRSWLAALDGAGWLCLLRCLLINALLIMRPMALGIILGFALRSFIRPPLISIGFLIAYAFFINILVMIFGPEKIMGSGIESVFEFLFSGFFAADSYDAIRLFRATWDDLLQAFLYTIPSILFPSVLAYFFFRRAELK